LHSSDDVAVAVAPRVRGHGLQVRAAAGLGEGHRGAHLAGGHPRQVALLLLLGAELAEQLRDHGVPAHRAREAHPAARELGGDQRVAGHGHRGLAVGLTDGQPEDAQLLHLLDELLRVNVLVLQLAHDRPDLAVDPVADGVDDGLLLGVQHLDIL
jgi:hypothetical protein